MTEWIAAASCLLALMPAVLFLRNLALYAPPPPAHGQAPRFSVLIPARNEEATIANAVSRFCAIRLLLSR
jgi:cellulose synthase/poly-beta-1,6-N-acetylglucosamine synthase-like glycosyltransferase